MNNSLQSTDQLVNLVKDFNFSISALFELFSRSSCILQTDARGIISYVNPNLCDTLGYEANELLGHHRSILQVPGISEVIYHHPIETLRSGNVWKGELCYKTKSGEKRWFYTHLMSFQDNLTGSISYLSINQDITANKNQEIEFLQSIHVITAQEEELRQTLNQIEEYTHVLEKTQIELQGQVTALNNAAIVSETDLQGNITFVNDTFCRIAKYTRDELLGKNHRILKSGHQPDELFVELWRTITSGRYFQGQVKNKAKDGTYYWVLATITPVLGKDGKPVKYISVRFDITKEKEQEEVLIQQAKEVQAVNNRLEQAKALLEAQVEGQRHELHDSVVYAERMQRTIIPSPKKLQENILDPFEIQVFFQAKDKVGGDFYWCGQWRNRRVIAVGDGSGHGVPGAFMSIIGITTLARLVEERGMLEPASILDEVDSEIIKLLNQTEAEGGNQDSIDMAICTLTQGKSVISYASAFRTSYLVRAKEIHGILPDKRPVGSTLFGKLDFNNQSIALQPGDVLFMFSDGFVDQLGGDGATPRKYGSTRFRNLLLSLTEPETFAQMPKHLSTELNNWAGIQRQTDDIVVVGIRHR